MTTYTLRSPKRFQDLPGDPGQRFIHEILTAGKQHILEELALAQRSTNDSFQYQECRALLGKKNISIGKRNVVFYLHFEDGVEWAARLRNPFKQANPDHDQELSRKLETRSMESEIATLLFVRQRTTIPVPDIHGFDCSFDNKLGCPYMFMNKIEGRPIPDVVEDAGGITDAQILKIHAQLAAISLQLARRCTLSHIGQLELSRDGADGKPFVEQIVDRHARLLGPFSHSTDYYLTRSRLIHEEAQRKCLAQQSIDSAHLHVISAPFTSIPQVDKGPFPLQHPDLHRQNVLINDNWTVVGIIDWSWASSIPWQSFRPLPFNLADYILPFDAKLRERHETLFWKMVECLEEGERETWPNLPDLSVSMPTKIASMMNRYAYPIDRDVDALVLRELLAKVGLSCTV